MSIFKGLNEPIHQSSRTTVYQAVRKEVQKKIVIKVP